MQRSFCPCRLPRSLASYLFAISASCALANRLSIFYPPFCAARVLENQTTYISDSYQPRSFHVEDTQIVLESIPLESNFKLEDPVLLPVENPTKSFWLDTPGANPLAEEGSKGELTEDADICVVGSGITGVSTAWHLSKMINEDSPQERTSVVILEARQFCSGATGRNGGHLTRNVFSSFLDRQALFNTSEATKSYLIEQYTSSSLVKFITEKGLSNKVDLVEGGHVTIFRTEEEESNARKDWAAAKEAGLDVDVTWIGNDELIEIYGFNSELNYTGLFHAGHNLWPCKLVTHLFKNAQISSNNVDISLHTKTPVTAITRNSWPSSDDDSLSSTTQHRRWKLHTPRSSIGCSYVVHATNGYASHLLPFLAGIEVAEPALPSISPGSFGGGRTPPSEEHPQPPHPHPQPSTLPPSRGSYGIVPTRGQVGAVRASVGPSEFKWLNSWDGGGGWEYWFPRHQDTSRDGTVTTKNPLIILGGGRESSGGKLEAGVADDSNLNPLVSTALRSFLPRYFPEQFIIPTSNQTSDAQVAMSEHSWEMEWTGIMAFTKDGDPLVGPVVVPQELRTDELHGQENYYEGQYIAAGYSGHGMPRAYGCAEAVASMIKAQIRGEAWARPSWLPEHYLTWATQP